MPFVVRFNSPTLRIKMRSRTKSYLELCPVSLPLDQSDYYRIFTRN